MWVNVDGPGRGEPAMLRTGLVICLACLYPLSFFCTLSSTFIPTRYRSFLLQVSRFASVDSITKVTSSSLHISVWTDKEIGCSSSNYTNPLHRRYTAGARIAGYSLRAKVTQGERVRWPTSGFDSGTDD